MRYVSIDRRRDGFSIDPSDYLEQLPQLAESLPAGAKAFVTDPQHYDFEGRRFIKNLKPQRLTRGEADGTGWIQLQLRHNCWRHDEDVTIRYHGVLEIVLDPAPADDTDVTELREVLLDETLPHEHGCTHEIACLGGSLMVVCQDLTATWSEAACSASSA